MTDSKPAPLPLWIVGKVNPLFHKMWQFQGVFSSEQKALAACRNEHNFIAPAILDESQPAEPQDWLGAYYPRAPEDLSFVPYLPEDEPIG